VKEFNVSHASLAKDDAKKASRNPSKHALEENKIENYFFFNFYETSLAK